MQVGKATAERYKKSLQSKLLLHKVVKVTWKFEMQLQRGQTIVSWSNFFFSIYQHSFMRKIKNWSKTKMRLSTIPKFLLMYRIGLKSKQVLKKHDHLEKKKKQNSKPSLFLSHQDFICHGGLAYDARRQCFRESLTFIHYQSQTL